MLFSSFGGWELEGLDRFTRKCTNCSNTAEHTVVVTPYGPQMGIIFSKKPLLGMRKYHIACTICGYRSKEISKEQAFALRDDTKTISKEVANVVKCPACDTTLKLDADENVEGNTIKCPSCDNTFVRTFEK